MYQRRRQRPLDAVFETDLPGDELERLRRVDALLRVVAAHDLDGARFGQLVVTLSHRRRPPAAGSGVRRD
jgi:hypothetical protein